MEYVRTLISEALRKRQHWIFTDGLFYMVALHDENAAVQQEISEEYRKKYGRGSDFGRWDRKCNKFILEEVVSLMAPITWNGEEVKIDCVWMAEPEPFRDEVWWANDYEIRKYLMVGFAWMHLDAPHARDTGGFPHRLPMQHDMKILEEARRQKLEDQRLP